MLQKKVINVQFASDVPNIPALFIVGREPFSAESRFPPREYTVDLEANSQSSLTDGVVCPSESNEQSLGSLFYSLES